MNFSHITIVLPTRNESKNIQRFLRTLPPAIHLIVVDASTDDTPELVTKLRPRNTEVLREVSTVTEARQLGADRADTPWIMFTDADVILPSGYFARLPRYADYDLVYGPKLSWDEFMCYYQWVARGQQLSAWSGIPAATGSNMIISRHALNAVSGFDLELTCNEDSELAWRVKRAGFRTRFVRGLVVYAADHRRLRGGLFSKTAHSIARCALLYTGALPARWRRHDWGYWSKRERDELELEAD